MSAQSFSPQTSDLLTAPVIETDRLRLRGYASGDFDALKAFFATERAQYVDPPSDVSAIWASFAAEVGSWSLHGWGGWTIERKSDGAVLGQTAISQPPHFPELELGWILFDGFEGKGYAAEAAKAARQWGWDSLPHTSLVSYIDPKNTRSRVLAERLGARLDPEAKRPNGETAEECVVYRHEREAQS